MSWPLASFAIVAGILLAGWLAYERSRPSARMVAVVATLAAVAALGRDAFVALPDVKPITAIALVVGYALGPLPGFTVGAIGMLASNMMLGQGPYTPWQMAAWGLVGLAGALLGRVSARCIGRFGLALACAVMALVAKEIMNVYTWTLGAAHTPAAFLLIAGQALPFDITDTVASFLFGFAFGPELARLLGRMRARMTVEWEPSSPPVRPAVTTPPPLLLVMVLVCAGIAFSALPPRARGASSLPITTAAQLPPVRAHAATSSAIARAVAYLQRAQNSDGGFGGAPGQHSSELYSAWVAIGLAAAGRDPLTLTRDGHSLLSSLRGEAATLEGAGDDERTILALHACGLPASDFPGTSLLAELVHGRSSDGSFGQLVNITAFAIFALRVAGSSADNLLVSDAGHWIAAQQDSDGGFGFAGRGGGEDVDDTAAALQAVIDASGRRGGAVVARSVAYLRRAQNPDGGFPEQPGGESNAQSTAWAVQGLNAAGVNVGAVKRGHSRSPLAYLESLMAPNGSIYYSRTSAQTPVWVTAQALTALAAKPFPIGPDFSGG
ncbi:MAG TPA: prenyltransferase/squalene oxidase repeat-containing protein [Solirubrobacteraceae bacterium]|jgi:energy-coupling factor transport system substrate-specific component|nr:prenyltransferase/squalene oxidase repeat-containing protein [Solirubrobacteraceae bacterium]